MTKQAIAALGLELGHVLNERPVLQRIPAGPSRVRALAANVQAEARIVGCLQEVVAADEGAEGATGRPMRVYYHDGGVGVFVVTSWQVATIGGCLMLILNDKRHIPLQCVRSFDAPVARAIQVEE